MQPKIYISSDFHFFHENVMAYSGRYSADFRCIGDYQEALMLHLAGLVKRDDIFLFLGDIALGSGKNLRGCKELLGVLECDNMHFIRGNHDKWLTDGDIYEMGFKSVRDYLKIDRLLICHYPLCEGGEVLRGEGSGVGSGEISPGENVRGANPRPNPYPCGRRYAIHEHLWKKFYKNPAITKIIHGHTHNNAYAGFAGVEYVNVSVDKNAGAFNVVEFADVGYDEFRAMLQTRGVCEFSRQKPRK